MKFFGYVPSRQTGMIPPKGKQFIEYLFITLHQKFILFRFCSIFLAVITGI